MSIPGHVVPRQVAGDDKAERDRAIHAKQLLLGRYLDPWGPPEIVWCHAHNIVRGLKVILNVYDLLPPRLNGFLATLRLGGAFHSGIQVGATEYAFGGHPDDDLGITVLAKPLFKLREEAQEAVRLGEDEHGAAASNLEWMPTLRSRMVVGWWMGPLSELEAVLRELRFDECWIGSEYRLLSRNCNHFARAMCAAMLRNPLFKPAPGRRRPDDMVPRSVTRLPAVVLALGCCAPCIVRRLNAPIPLAPHSLNVFQGQPRKAGPDPARLPPRSRSRPQSRAGTPGVGSGAGTTHNPINISVSATAAAAGGGGASGVVRRSSLSTTSSAGGGGGGGAGHSCGWPAGGPPPAAVVATAAAAAEGLLLRPRLEGRYHSLCVETAPRPSIDRPGPLANNGRRLAEDGGGGGGSGADTPVVQGTGCSTPDLAAAVAAAAAGGPATCNGRAHVRSPQSPRPDLAPSSPLTTLAGDSAAAADGPLTPTSTVVASAASPHSPAACPGPSPASLPPLIVVMAEGAAAPCPSAAAAAATPSTRTSGPRFLNSSRSGRRIFPDPRVAPPGPDGHGDAAHDSAVVNAPRGQPPADVSSSRDLSRGDLESAPLAAARDGEALPGLRPQAVTGPGSSTSASPRQLPRSSRSQLLHTTPRCSASGALPPLALQPAALLPRLDGSPARPQLAPLPLPPSPAQQHQQQHQLPLQQAPPLPAAAAAAATLAAPRSAVPTADGSAVAGAAASGAAAAQQSPSEAPRPWSVLSGGFIDLLFAPTSTEPPPGVPHPVTVSRTGTGTGTGSAATGTGSGAAASTGAGGPGGGRRYSSFTGDGGGLFSGVSNATGGGFLEPVASGDLSDDVDVGVDGDVLGSPHGAAALRVRASTGMLGGGEQALGADGAFAAAAAPPASGMAAAAAAATHPLRTAGAVGRGASRSCTGPGLTSVTSAPPASLPVVAAGTPAAAAAAGATAAAADGNGNGNGPTPPVPRREAF
ncbi:hypothetical protein PLESTB_000993900 [Pleodorina starrii]|uniref:PPPDE domain-containing protein n=1 Tax=Pleodorina starrii TaxID=330485 RepID=A0A9W6F3T9_9CHLO|nr:hypothetical protein PLESTM_001852900 [Pleodorina starrii]GLC55498.1 hypothetical protein PLESTB_000993900 [Pleodorina starrii]GLC76379.1 hypothetical protein PLESTF_001774100 [Pleodorina starrii]